MKKQTLLLAALIAAASASAGPLTPEEALARAEGMGLLPRSRAAEPQLVYTAKARKAESAALYVFNRGNESGYMVLSADDRITPVLGYSDNGTFSESEMPDNMRYWLDCYADQIAFAANNPAAADAPATVVKKVFGASASERRDIAPLCKTRWNQNAPYNNDCPKIGTAYTYTGCVATAMAQALKYHSYPEKGRGVKQYTWEYQHSGQTKSMIVRFPFSTTTFDWANMLDTYPQNGYNTTQAKAVSTLMKAAGVGVEMNYGTSASGAHSQDIPETLIDNFNYDVATAYYYRDLYSISEWEEMVYNNLATCGPVIYGANSNEGGHSFICDGYMNGYFHINWGWGGMSDGFFLLTALDPESQGIGGSSSAFIYNQDAILGMRPPVEGSKPVYMLSACTVMKNQGYDFTATVSGSLMSFGATFNPGSTTFNGVLGVRIENQDGGTPTYVKCPQVVSNLDGWSQLITSWNVTLPSTLPNGTYKVYPSFAPTLTPSASDWEPLLMPEGYPRFYTVTKSGSSYIIKNVKEKSFEVTDLKFDTEVYDGMPFTITYTITNPNDFPRSAQVGPNFIKAGSSISSSVVAYGPSVLLSLDANETRTLTQTFKLTSNGLSAGDYSCFIGEDVVNANGNVSVSTISDKYTVAVKKLAAGTKCTVSDLSIDNRSAVNAAALTGTYKVTGVGGYVAGVLSLKIYDNKGSNMLTSYNLPAFFVNNGETKTETFNVIFPDGVPGTSYMAVLFSNNTQLSDPVLFIVNSFTGIDDVEAGSEIVAEEYYNLQGIRVDADRLTPGVYVVRSTTADGKVSTRKTLIK